MSYVERTNGTHAIHCDTEDCKREIIAPTRDDVYGDCVLTGWQDAGKDEKTGEGLHVCLHCTNGIGPLKAVIYRMLGGNTFQETAPCQVSTGDPCHDDNGNLIGHYLSTANQGESVDVKVHIPEPEKPTSTSANYAAMMAGSDEDDDASGLRSAVAPDRAAPPVVAAAARAAGHTLARQHEDMSAEVHDLFDSITDWDPDGE